MQEPETHTLATIFCQRLPIDVPVFLDWHVYDIPETMRKAIFNAPDNVVAISFNETDLPTRWKNKVIEWCSERGIEAKWWTNPEKLY